MVAEDWMEMDFFEDVPPRPRPVRKLTPRIEEHTDEELERAIKRAARVVPFFWILVHGIDAFMERRRRRETLKSPERKAIDQVRAEFARVR